jgi:transcriptional regulator with XRE-family HTH domain
MFYDKFVRLCNERGVSPSSVAVKVGVDKSAVTRWSKGAEPRYPTLMRIADYFGVSMDDLNGDPEPPPQNEPATITNEDGGLEAALEALRNQPGRRALLSATKGMTEAQVLRMADWLSDITGGDKN